MRCRLNMHKRRGLSNSLMEMLGQGRRFAVATFSFRFGRGTASAESSLLWMSLSGTGATRLNAVPVHFNTNYVQYNTRRFTS